MKEQYFWRTIKHSAGTERKLENLKWLFVATPQNPCQFTFLLQLQYKFLRFKVFLIYGPWLERNATCKTSMTELWTQFVEGRLNAFLFSCSGNTYWYHCPVHFLSVIVCRCSCGSLCKWCLDCYCLKAFVNCITNVYVLRKKLRYMLVHLFSFSFFQIME